MLMKAIALAFKASAGSTLKTSLKSERWWLTSAKVLLIRNKAGTAMHVPDHVLVKPAPGRDWGRVHMLCSRFLTLLSVVDNDLGAGRKAEVAPVVVCALHAAFAGVRQDGALVDV